MDRYEFNIKVEQMKKMINKGDYEMAMKIADTIDWRRVRNTNLLSQVAQVYEKNEEYQEAKDILLLAFERAPIGKRLLYKLSELALKEGNLSEAETYYKEFCEIAGDDPRQHILRYLILKAKGAPVDQLIHSLEGYTSIELEEKWLYELAELYQKAGMERQCVSVCDKIMLMFGLGKYVDKAMELKQQYAPLTGYQKDLVANRDKYEAKLRAVEQQFSSAPDSMDDDYEDGSEDMAEDMSMNTIDPEIDEDNLEVKMQEAEVEARLAAELSRMEDSMLPDTQPEENEMAHTRILNNIRDIKHSSEAAVALEEQLTVEDDDMAQIMGAEDGTDPYFISDVSDGIEGEEFGTTNHFMIETLSPETGLELALETLKRVHMEQGTKHQIAKITGEKLNKKGLLASVDMLEGKDLIIEQAGSLSQAMLEELDLLMDEDTSGINVILIDSPKRIESLHRQHASLAMKFDCIGTNEKQEIDVNYVSAALNKQAEEQERMVKELAAPQKKPVRVREPEQIREPEPVRQFVKSVEPETAYEPDPAFERENDRESVGEPVKPARPVIPPAPSAKKQVPKDYHGDDEREMDLDEFAQYATKYATEIDCNVSGKSMLALYERIEIMEEDGIPLTRENAELLIEEAADRAEKPSIGKLIKGVFSSKYDKDGLLILKEEHFIY